MNSMTEVQLSEPTARAWERLRKASVRRDQKPEEFGKAIDNAALELITAAAEDGISAHPAQAAMQVGIARDILRLAMELDANKREQMSVSTVVGRLQRILRNHAGLLMGDARDGKP